MHRDRVSPPARESVKRQREQRERQREFDELMAEARAAKKRKRKPKPKSKRPRGNPGNPLRQTILKDARQRIAAEKTEKLAANLHADYEKKGGPRSAKTISRWLAKDDG